ncbi:DUF4040 domain-containing protein [Ancylobacter sp. 6x-1]|uniref:DUF4040 domain-containing protein n=1 Tax=Ancylobacter crimeensis TaxID=2579147 RepID=A0ABT0D733_9HYPH|nr:hydrogenase subunit MbhD domain-containing protein [Ancylobacter crimeensis]MCK0195760.1 DUF4040 domain-containing protein [Ancylobacter crimeensis]
MSEPFALLLTVLVLLTAGWIVTVRERRAAVLGFIAYGLLLALVWIRLAAVDVALTEAAIGGGATGVLLLRVAARLGDLRPMSAQPGRMLKWLAGLVCAGVSLALMALVLALPDPAPSLAGAAMEPLARTGLGNPVTAVLLAYRALDTFLEIIVLLLALIGVWSLGPDRFWGGRPAAWYEGTPSSALTFLARVLPPFGIVIAGYLFWIGADEPGGKFQASTLLAAMWLLTMMAGLVAAPRTGSPALRGALAFGPLVFLVVGLAGIGWGEGFLAYPDRFAKPLILLIEAALAVSIVAALALMVAGPAERNTP